MVLVNPARTLRRPSLFYTELTRMTDVLFYSYFDSIQIKSGMPYLLMIRAVLKSISISDVNEMVFLIPFRRFFHVFKIRLSHVSV